MKIVRRLFVVPLADNDHGKTTMIHGLSRKAKVARFKSRRKEHGNCSPRCAMRGCLHLRAALPEWKSAFGNVEAALDGNDAVSAS